MSRNEADQLIDERINVYNNLSVAQLKVKSIDESLGSADTVLKLQPNNVKALFRKGKVGSTKKSRHYPKPRLFHKFMIVDFRH